MSVKAVLRARQSARFAGAATVCVQPLSGLVSEISTSRSGCAYGSGRSSTARATVNIAVVAAMPTASVRMATTANAGFLPEAARRVAHVLQRRVDEGQAAVLVLSFRDLHRTAESEHRLTPGFVGRRAPADVLLGQQVQVGRHLEPELIVLPPPGQGGVQARGEDGEPGRHGVSVGRDGASASSPRRSAPSSAPGRPAGCRPARVIA